MAYTNAQESVIVKGPAPLEPVSRTYQYRKVMKPMLERKRRARINRCLDELKELMVTALQSEGENVSKLEKADILGKYQFNYNLCSLIFTSSKKFFFFNLKTHFCLNSYHQSVTFANFFLFFYF